MKLFWSTFGISAFTFGGGYVIIPLMQKTFVGKLKWIENNEMLDLTAIAQSSPGPIAVNAAILVGYKTAGKTGALISTAGAVLPPLIIISIISLFYQALDPELPRQEHSHFQRCRWQALYYLHSPASSL